VGAQMVIGIQKAAAGPLLNISHQRASLGRRQVRLLQLSLPQIRVFPFRGSGLQQQHVPLLAAVDTLLLLLYCWQWCRTETLRTT